MEKPINDATGQSTDMMILSINAEFEKHCIEITNLDKPIKDIENKLKDIEKLLWERVAELENSNTDTLGSKNWFTKRKIKHLAEKKTQLNIKKAELQGQRTAFQKQTTSTLEADDIKQLIAGKTSGVTGGAVVEIERNGERKQYMLKNIFNTEKTYKNIFGREKRHSGKHFYDPNCKSETRSFFTRHTLKEVNDSVIQEFIALKLANVVRPGIAPDAILGKIAGDGNGEQGPVRYCLLTEMAGQGDDEKFNTLDKLAEKNQSKNDADSNDLYKDVSSELNVRNGYGVNKAKWKSFFAIGIGLLNDKDVAKKDNIGIVKNTANQSTNLSLFDLGHASPDEFKLDKKTLLPKSKSKLADFFLWVINLFTPANSIPGTFYFDNDIQNILTVDERNEALVQLIDKKDEVLEELKNIKKEMDDAGKNVVEDMERRIQARFKQLRAVLEEHSKLPKVQSASSGQIDLSKNVIENYEV